MHTTIIEVNTSVFIANLQAIRKKIGNDVKFCLPVKANAYGHGLVKISQLAEPYIDYLGVSCLDEGATLRQAEIKKPILVFGAFNKDEIGGLIANNLEVTVSSQFKAEQLALQCKNSQQKCKVHLKIDTGMNRVGVRVENATALFEFVLLHPELEIVGIYSHLADSDSDDVRITMDQITKFNRVAAYAKSINPHIICHLANSGGICYYPESYFDMVRPGILSYGYFPNYPIVDAPLNQIRSCFSLKSRIIYTKMVDAGRGVSYNHTYHTKCYSRVVTIPIGYGDGYRRKLSNIGEVLIRGKKYTIAGTICMDMLLVDMGANGQGYVEDEVVLIGNQQEETITVYSVADKCGTIIYEILCGFNERIPRIYIRDGNEF
ncbi:MAG: alanine racemase [Burkholderiales bacterium]|nr:alanine racemase [Burkholderiales bacterium]